MSNTPITDEAEEKDSYAFQALYPHMKYRGVKGERMRKLERENRLMRDALQEIVRLGAGLPDDAEEVCIAKSALANGAGEPQPPNN
jgi:hypothetical protein